MKKSLLTLLCLLTLGFVAKAGTIKITPTETAAANSSTSYVTNAFDLSVSDYTFKLNQVNPKSGQIKVNATGNSGFTLYNTTAIPGLKTVTLTADQTTVGTWYMKTSSDAEISTAATTSDIKGNVVEKTVTFTVPEGTDASYFHINLTSKGSGTVKFSSIEVYYENGGGETPDPDVVTAPAFAINGDAVSGEATCELGSTLTISSSEAMVLYTVDGSDPSWEEANGEEFPEDGIELNEIGEFTYKAIAINDEEKESDVVTLNITVTKKAHGLFWSSTKCTALLGSDENEFPTLENPNNLPVSYTSSNKEVATIDENGIITLVGIGTSQIRATFSNEDSDYATGYKYYTLTVNPMPDVTYNFNVDGAYGMTPQTISDKYETEVTSIANGNVILSFTGEKYRLWKATNGYELRVETSSSMTISALPGYVITKVEFTGDRVTSTYIHDGSLWEGESSSVNFTIDKVARISTILVYLAEAPSIEVFINDATHTSGAAYDLASYPDGLTIKISSSDPDVKIYHLWKPANDSTEEDIEEAPARIIRAEYVEHPETGHTVTTAGTFSYYAEKNGNSILEPQSIEIGGTTTGIEEVAVDADSKTVYYNLQGVEIENPTNGLYIRRQGQKVEKVVVK